MGGVGEEQGMSGGSRGEFEGDHNRVNACIFKILVKNR